MDSSLRVDIHSPTPEGPFCVTVKPSATSTSRSTFPSPRKVGANLAARWRNFQLRV